MSASLRRWIGAFRPQSLSIPLSEMARATLGATLGVLLTSGLSLHLSSYAGIQHWLVASLGASALLIFLVPSSPLAQPWNMLVGNVLGVVVGIACARLFPHPILAIAISVCAAMLLMLACHCVHPPSMAMAIFPALNGIHDFRFALFPVLFDSAALLALAIVYNRLTGVSYPPLHKPAGAPPAGPAAARFTDEDYDAALSHYNQSLNVSRDDLEKLLRYVHTSAFSRNMGTRRCATLMNPDPVRTHADMSLQDAWTLMRERNVKALPVLDQEDRVIGILTLSDFLRQAGLYKPDNLRSRFNSYLRLGKGKKARHTVGDIMTMPAAVARQDQSIAELIPLFSRGRHRHMPIVDADQRLVGMITQSDLMLDLYRILRPEPLQD